MLDIEDTNKVIEKVIDSLKAKGTFDQLRRECMADVDIKPSYRNLLQKVEGYVSKFLYRQTWSEKLNKSQLRNRLRNEINGSDLLKNGIQHLIDQVVNEKIKEKFKNKVDEALRDFLGINDENELEDSPKNKTDKNGKKEEILEEPTSVEVKIEEKPEPQLIERDFGNKIEEDSCELNEKIPQSNEPDVTKDNTDDVDMDIEWPTPPQPEMATPVHVIKEESMDSLQIDESYCDTSTNNTSNNNYNNYNNDVTSENENSKNYDSKDESKKNTTPLPPPEKSSIEESDVRVQTQADSDSNKKHTTAEPEKPAESPLTLDVDKDEDNEEDEISDVSSVHTSDLSDFDDRISIEGSDSDENTKKKISLKVVKELAASITEINTASISNTNSKYEEKQDRKKSKINEDKNSDEKSKSNEKQINKRKRKINPKFMSSEYSFVDKKSRKSEVVDDEIPVPKTNLKRKRVQEASAETPANSSSSKSESNKPKLMKQNSKQNIFNKKQSEQSSGNGNNIINYGKTKKNSKSRNDQSNKRYDSSDLYKPRHRLTSSRRGRPSSLVDRPMTPDSNSNSNDDHT